MVVERFPVVILPSGRVPGRVLLVLPILEARRRNRDEITKKGSVLECFGTRCKYMPKGASEEARGARAPWRRDQEGGRPLWSPGAPVGPLWPYFGRMEASGTLIFYIFFPGFFWQFT